MRLPLLLGLFTIPGCLFASYSYYYTDSLTSINTANWYQNGTLTATTGGLTAPTANGGALVSKVGVPDGSSNYEVKSTLTLPSSGGTYVQLLRATSNAVSGPGAAGTYYSIELQNPAWSGGYCSATLAVYKRVSNSVTLLSSTTVNCYNGMVMRTVVRPSVGLFVILTSPYVNTIYGWPTGYNIVDSAITTGAAGVGAYNTPAGNAISQVQLGPLDQIAPGTVNAQSVGTYALPNRVEMQWQGVIDDANGIGLWDYYVYRNGVYIGQSFTPEYDDDAVVAGTTYTYTIQALDAHQNASASTALTVVTPPLGAIDARRIGVRPLGSYWGDAGEQIDTLSGNLNFTYPVFTVMGRGGWSTNFALNYNSQMWRQDPGGTWKLGRDVGYGFGWRLMAGSITPIWTDTWGIELFIFTDSTGAEYRLDQYDQPNCMWTSLEGVHFGYNPCVNRLYFPDGSYWFMGATSGGTEQDAGVLYPTMMEDPNGNQVLIAYQNGISSPLTNSSARVSSVEDVRAVNTGGGPSGYQTYSLTYNTDPIPHLTDVTSHITGVGNWTLTYLSNQALNSPFAQPVSFGTTTLLSTAGRASDGLASYQFQYASSGSAELTQVTTMQGGILAWAYRNFTYTGSRTFREVQNRYLTMQAGGTQYTYPFTRNDAGDASLSLHSGVTLDDPSGIGEKAWTFTTTGAAWQLGLTTRFEDRPSAANAGQPLQRKDFTWVQDSAGTPYIGTVLTTLDPATANVQTKTTQTLDTHGNLTQTAIYDYGNLATAARTYNYAYNYSFFGYGFTSYRLTSASVTNGTQTLTLVTNTYDSTALTNVTSLREHDAGYGTGYISRGNLSVRTPVGGPTTTINRDITGNVVSTNDGQGHTVSVTTSTATNYAAPDVITPNSNTNLNQSMAYTQSLAVSSLTGPNSATASATYDVWSRPASTTSVFGAVTTYAYSNTSYGPLVQMTTNGRWEQHYLDGFGRTYTLNRGYGSTFVSTVNTLFGPCACSPLGKMTQVSQPYAPSGTQYWTTYTYDGLGRTVKVVLPDAASTTTYAYYGNTTTITDPAGKWKKQTTDVFGNLTQMNEPNPAGGADYVTSYTYDMLNHLTQVSMPRPTGTQTRTFVYDPTTQRLTSETQPETGTTSYTYNTDGTLATKTNARSQVTKYIYDTYQRVTQTQYFPYPSQPTVEDTCARVTWTYDTNTLDTTFSQNSWGRPTTATWGANGCVSTNNHTFRYMYSYTSGGLITKKRVQLDGHNLDATYTYNNEGRVATVQHPSTPTDPGLTYTYSFDSMGRPYGLVDNEPTPYHWVNSVTYGPSDEEQQMNGTTNRTYNSLLQMTWDGIRTYYYSATQNNGRIVQSSDANMGTVGYGYDSLNRLVSANSSTWGETFTYDGFGNLTDKTVTSGAAPALHVTMDPAANNRLSNLSGYSYDATGNLAGGPGFGASYDVQNRMAAFAPTSGGTEYYSYGPDNMRVWKKPPSGGEEVYFYGAQGEKLGRFSYGYGAFGTLRRSVYFGARILSESQDRLGSWWDQGGYYPYGEAQNSGNNDFDKFATYYRDGTSLLDYARNRYYSSTLGRFMSADPYGGSMSLANPGSLNRYAYVNGDPVNFNDPSGLVGHCPAGMHTDSTGMGCEPDGVNFEYLISSPGWLFWLGVGGAGASGGGAVAATPAEVARREMSKVAPIATDALKNNDCLGLFGSGAKDPKEILNTMITTASYKDKGTSYVARYNTVTGSLTINTHTGPEATYWNTSWSLQALEDAVTLLHELGHATSKNAGNQFINDTSLFGKTDPAKAWTNDELIWTKCFGREDPFPKP